MKILGSIRSEVLLVRDENVVVRSTAPAPAVPVSSCDAPAMRRDYKELSLHARQ
jgi:hypothetical protein